MIKIKHIIRNIIWLEYIICNMCIYCTLLILFSTDKKILIGEHAIYLGSVAPNEIETGS